MSLKKKLLGAIDLAIVLANECEQSIEVRGAINKLNQAKGSVAQWEESFDLQQEPPATTVEFIEGTEETIAILDDNMNVVKGEIL